LVRQDPLRPFFDVAHTCPVLAALLRCSLYALHGSWVVIISITHFQHFIVTNFITIISCFRGSYSFPLYVFIAFFNSSYFFIFIFTIIVVVVIVVIIIPTIIIIIITITIIKIIIIIGIISATAEIYRYGK
jgi:hypothetical protein